MVPFLFLNWSPAFFPLLKESRRLMSEGRARTSRFHDESQTNRIMYKMFNNSSVRTTEQHQFMFKTIQFHVSRLPIATTKLFSHCPPPLVKYRLQGTFYCPKNGKKTTYYWSPTFYLQVKSRTPVKSPLLLISHPEALVTANRYFT